MAKQLATNVLSCNWEFTIFYTNTKHPAFNSRFQNVFCSSLDPVHTCQMKRYTRIYSKLFMSSLEIFMYVLPYFGHQHIYRIDNCVISHSISFLYDIILYTTHFFIIPYSVSNGSILTPSYIFQFNSYIILISHYLCFLRDVFYYTFF